MSKPDFTEVFRLSSSLPPRSFPSHEPSLYINRQNLPPAHKLTSPCQLVVRDEPRLRRLLTCNAWLGFPTTTNSDNKNVNNRRYPYGTTV